MYDLVDELDRHHLQLGVGVPARPKQKVERHLGGDDWNVFVRKFVSEVLLSVGISRQIS